MDFAEQFLGEQGARLMADLVSQVGFSQDQAQAFVPAAVQKVLAVVKGGGLDLGSLLGGGGISSLVSQVDTDDLASAAGLDREKASAGLTALAPALLSALRDKGGSAAGVLALLGGQGGGLLGAAGGLAGKLFK